MNWLWESFSKNPFSAISVIIAVTALIVFQWWRQRKSLRYKVLSAESVADVSEEFNDRVKILFDNKPVKRASLIVTEIVNDGWMPIEDKDFFEPVTVSFGDDAEIMTCEVIDCAPSNLKVELICDTSQVTIKPLLLNRGDSIKVKALVGNYQKPVIVNGRVKGVPRIKSIISDSTFAETVSLFSSTTFGFLLILILWKAPEWTGARFIQKKLYRVALNSLNPEEISALDKELIAVESSARTIVFTTIFLFVITLGLYLLSKYIRKKRAYRRGQ
jgi:hypothetical protein